MKKSFFLFLLLLVAAFACTPDTPAQYSDIMASQAAEIILDKKDVKILDIRTPSEFEDGHLQGAINVDFYGKDFESRLKALDKEATYLVYCRSGNRSSKSLELFKDLGFKNILHLKKGTKDWVAQGLPLVK